MDDTSKDDLFEYIRTVAETVGKKSEVDNDSLDNQAPHSLLWYVDNLLRRDLDKSSPYYNEILDAYLSGNTSRIGKTEPLKEDDIAEIRRKCDERFPRYGSKLNKRQVEAIAKGLTYPLSLIQGPPGTGKTVTILHLAALAVDAGQTVAIVSSNKTAVDNVREKIEVALEQDEAVQDEPAPVDLVKSLAHKYAPLGNTALRKDSGLGFYSGAHRFKSGEETKGWEQSISFLEFTKDRPCVTSTIHSLKKCFKDGDDRKFDLVIMDEASQASVLLGIVAMSSAKRMCVVGDTKQLPPVFTNENAEAVKTIASDLGIFDQIDGGPYDMSRQESSFLLSLEEVFADYLPTIKTRLNVHYRCREEIIGFCNEAFYGNELIVSTPRKDDDVIFPLGVRWYEGDYRESCYVKESPEKKNGDAPSHKDREMRRSARNMKQIAILEHEEMGHILDLVKAGKSICFLSPFVGQIVEIQKLLSRKLKSAKIKAALEVETIDSGEGAASSEAISLTVHKSQGQEFDVVYFLPVEDGNWEWPWSQGSQIVNVAVSRAMSELHLITSTKMLDEDLQHELTKHMAAVKDPATSEMYVRELFGYAFRLWKEGLNAATRKKVLAQDKQLGIERSFLRSIFDSVTEQQDPAGNSDDVSAPEKCFEKELVKQVEWGEKGLRWARAVTFSEIEFSDGQTLAQRCKHKYKVAENAHFDFVVVNEDREIVMTFEIDGAYHRFKRSNKGYDYSTYGADHTKDKVAAFYCQAQPCVLQFTRKLPCFLYKQEGASDEDKKSADQTTQPVFLQYPSQLSSPGSFLYFRIPSDGSTMFEFESYWPQERKAYKKRYAPHGVVTINEFFRKREELLKSSAPPKSLRVSDAVELQPFNTASSESR